MPTKVIADTKRLNNLIAELQSGNAVASGTYEIADRVGEIVDNNWSGIVTNGEGRSKAGQEPAMETGSLARSQKIRKIVKGYSVQWGGRSSPHYVQYAKYLEFGTRKMAARPFLRPAADQVSTEIRGIIKNAIIVTVKRL